MIYFEYGVFKFKDGIVKFEDGVVKLEDVSFDLHVQPWALLTKVVTDMSGIFTGHPVDLSHVSAI